jgi:uncharacterized protein YjfI (DUF2170 family)
MGRIADSGENNMEHLQERLNGLEDLIAARLSGTVVSFQPIPGTIPVVQVVIGGREELPIFVTASHEQILCICYLWADAEVQPARRAELMEVLLELNPAMPLSSFGRVDGRYMLFGALSANARAEDIADDIVALSENALEALEALADYLI